MLGSQHINRKIASDTFFSRISMGLSFADFQKKNQWIIDLRKLKKELLRLHIHRIVLEQGLYFIFHPEK